MIHRIRASFSQLPRVFWTLTGAMFIDRLGGALVFPFLSLYVSTRFNVGMTQVGLLFGIFAISGMFGSILGGALTDKFGRKVLLLLGLVLSASSAVLMGFVPSMEYFYILAAVVGLLSDLGGPAQQAMVADLLPEEKRAQGYGVLRVGANLAVTIGPMIGGLLAGVSYLLLFIIDAVMSLITAGIVLAAIPETHPQASDRQARESFTSTLKGYSMVGRDRLFIAFLLAATVMTLVYMQMNSTLSVYLNRFHGVPPQGFGYILSLNAAMVVAFQFWISGRLQGKPPLIVLAIGSILYAVGFGMYGFVNRYGLFMLAMVIITIGEMLVVPVWQAVVARFAPADMRGRYMAIAGMSWTIPSAFGPLAAGLIIDNLDPEWLWYACIFLALAAAIWFIRLHGPAHSRLEQLQEEAGDPAVV